MSVRYARPTAKELTFQLYSRALHPELFDTCATRVLEHPAYTAVLRICEAGHVVQWRRDECVVSEINTTEHQELPKRGRCLAIRLRGGRDLNGQPHPGLTFHASTQVELLEPEVFERLSEEFRGDLQLATLSHVFTSSNRLRPEPLSLMHVDCGPRCLVVHTFHTFPDEFAVVRTQSLYEF